MKAHERKQEGNGIKWINGMVRGLCGLYAEMKEGEPGLKTCF